MRFFIVVLTTLVMSNLFAEDYLYIRNVPSCTIKKLIDGKLQPTLKNHLLNIPLDAQQFERTPKFIKFKVKEQTYVASTKCIFVATDDHPIIKDVYHDEYLLNEPIEREIRLARERKESLESQEAQLLHKQYSLHLNNYFIELGGGVANITDQNQIPLDYNTLFPTDPTTPVTWSEADKSLYKTKTLINIGFGIKQFDNGFLAFKFRSFKGTKLDTLTSTNINTSTTATGSWNYSEALTSYYIGYKYLFTSNSSWKPTVSAYLGANSGNTNMSDGTTSYSFTSLGMVGLAEAGVEYLINANISLSINLGYEYVGARTLKPTDTSGTTATSQTKLNYSNTSGTLGIKSYF